VRCYCGSSATLPGVLGVDTTTLRPPPGVVCDNDAGAMDVTQRTRGVGLPMARRVGVLGAVTVVVVSLGASPAHAADLAVPLTDQIEIGTAEGEVVELTRVSSGEFVGSTCRVTARRGGDAGEFPGNNLLVTSGGAGIQLDDADRAPGAVSSTGETLQLGAVVRVELEMGPAEEFSGDVVLEFDCDPPPPESTTAAGAAADPNTGNQGTSTRNPREAQSDQAAAPVPAPAPDGTDLPETGVETAWATAFGTVFLAGGLLLRRIARRPDGAVR
jgi:LPXTG-motif cell wall-anchored protein